MAESLFGNKYRQAVDDESIVRQKLDSSGGLTGWAAITAAMGGLGGELGYQGGQMFGGQTPAQVQEAAFNSVMDSVPDFDPTNPESLQTMSSALWQGGFYDEGMAMMNQSRTIQKDDALIELYKAQAQDELTVDGPSPTEIIATDKAALDKKAIEAVKTMPQTTYEEQQAVQAFLWENGYSGSSIYKEINDKLGTTKWLGDTGTAEGLALKQKRDEYIAAEVAILGAELGETKGNELFLDYLQGLDESTAGAAAKIDLGKTIFTTTMKVRDATRDKLNKISTGISQFSQAKAGSAAAGEIAETLIAQIFEDKRQATTEIKRIASAGNLVENVIDFANTVFSGVKTAEHYAAFIKTLQIYEQEQSKKYSDSNNSMKQIGIDYGFEVPDSVFEVYIPRDGTLQNQIKQWNPDTQSFDLVNR